MKNKILIAILVILLGGLGIITYRGILENKKINSNIDKTVANFNKVYNFLEKNISSLPIPNGDIILVDKKGETIHLEDRNIPLNKVNDLYAIQGTTCNIFKDNKTFKKINYDSRYSIHDKDTIYVKKCFAYSVTKDGKYYQIGTILGGKAVLKGNTDKNLIKAYDGPVLVKNGSKDFLPYAGEKVSPIFKVENLGNSKITLTVIDDEENKNIYNLSNGNNYILTGNVNGTYQISLRGNVSKNTKIRFIDTNGSIVYISGNSNGYIDFGLKDYRIDTNRVDYIVETGKFLADIIKLSPDKKMTVNKGGTTLVIRGTKFAINSDNKIMSTYLVLGKILQKMKNGGDITLDIEHSFSSLLGNKFITNLEQMKELIGFIVYNDIINNPKYDYNVNKLGDITMTDIYGGLNVSINVNYSNKQNIGLIFIKRNNIKKIISENIDKQEIEDCHGKIGCIKLKKYKNLVNNICKKSNRYKKGLDLSKLYYLLDNTDKLYKFKLKDKIEGKLGIKNYVIFTSRGGGTGKLRNESSRVVYKESGKIDNIYFSSLDKETTYSNIKNLIFACTD